MATTPLDPTQSAHGAPTAPPAPPAAPAAPAATGTVRDRLADLATRFQRVDLSVEVHLNDPAIGDGAELAIRTRIESLFDETRAALGISGFTDVSFDSRVHPAVEIGVAVEIAVVIEPAIEPIGPDGAWEHDRASSSLVYDIAPGKGASGGFGRPAPSGDELFAKIRVIVSDVLLDLELVLDGALPSDSGETPSAVLVVRTPDGDRTFDFDLRNQIGSYQSRSDTTVRPSLALWVTLPSVHGVSEVGQRRIDERVGQAVGDIARIAGLPEADVQVSFAPATESVHQAYGISATFSERTGPGGPGLPVPGQACDTPVFGIDIFGTDTYGNAPAAGRHEDPLLVDIRDAIRAAHERAVIRQDKPSRSERQLASTGRQGAGWHVPDGTIIGQSDDLQLVIEINPGGRKACTRVYKAVEAGIRGWALATLGISDLPIHVIPADPEGTVPRGGFVTTWSIRVRGTEVDPTGLRPFAERITVTPPEGSTLVVVNAILDAFLAVTADYAGPSSRHIREDAEARLHKAFAEWGPPNEAYRLALRELEADCTSCEALGQRDAFLLRCIDREARVRTAFDVFRDYAPARFGVVHQWVDGILSELDAASYVY